MSLADCAISSREVRVDLDDTWIELHEWRADDPIRTVVFWHGLGATASGAEFVEVGPRLAAAGLNVVAVDAPGFGASPALPPDGYRFSALGQLLQRVVDALGLEQPVLVGHSWGASVVASCAAAFPELPGALVLVDGGHLDVADLPQIDTSRTIDEWIEHERTLPGEWTSRSALETERAASMRRRTPELLAAHTAGARQVGSLLIGASPEVRGAAMNGLLDRISGGWQALGEHRIPTLLLLATEPPYRDQNLRHLAAFQAAVPHAEVWWVRDAGHNVLVDAGPSIGDDIAEWIRAIS